MTLKYARIPQSSSQREMDLLKKIEGNKFANIICVGMVFIIAAALLFMPIIISTFFKGYESLQRLSTQAHVPALALFGMGVFAIWYQRNYIRIIRETLKKPLTKQVFIKIYLKKVSDRNHTKHIFADVSDSQNERGHRFQLRSCSKDTLNQYSVSGAATAYYHPPSNTLLLLATPNEILRVHSPQVVSLLFKSHKLNMNREII